MATFQPRESLDAVERPIGSVAFSPDGKTLAAVSFVLQGGGPGQVILCDPASGARSGACELQAAPRRVAFAPDGKTLAAGLDDGTIVLWDPATGPGGATVAGHAAQIVSLSFAPDGRTLASAAFDGSVKLWRLPRPPLVARSTLAPSQAAGPVRGLFARRQNAGHRRQRPGAAALGCDGHRRGPARVAHRPAAHCAAFSPDGRTLVTGGRQGLLTVWDPATGKPRATPTGETGLIRIVAFAPDGKTLVSAALQNQALAIWDTATWEVIRTVPARQRPVLSLAFSPDGKTLAVGTSRTGWARTR